MSEDISSIDELINDIKSCLDSSTPEVAPEAECVPEVLEEADVQLEPLESVQPVKPVPKPAPKKRSVWKKILVAFGTFLLILVETVLLLAGAAYGAMYVLAKGPSPTARDMFVRSVRETSAGGFLANLFFSEEEIAQIMGGVESPEYVEMDQSLIQLPTKPNPGDPDPEDPVADAWGLVDEDGDGLILEKVVGEGYSGHMLVILDPSRVTMGSVPSSYGSRGYTVEQMVKHFDAVAGINGGGFHDPNGQGNGSIPNTMVVYDGKIYYPEFGTQDGFAGFDSNHILHVGNFTPQQIKERDIQYGVCFGPVLVVNGQKVDEDILDSGLNPRTAIGQRSDGAILMLIIDGRQIASLGASYNDLADIMLSYGAVNACNLDGGSSSMMWYKDGYVNNSASLIGIRPIPTTFLVLKEGDAQ